MSNRPRLTTEAGAPVADNQHSQTAGAAGPVLLQDHHLLEKLARFNRERIPERVVHAVGSGAYGYFEVTNPNISNYTLMKLFDTKGKRTEVFLRFSTVAGSKGAPDTARDPRGFAVRFYTEDGNWDVVGNNTPVFFLRDGIKFPDFIHSQKYDPFTNCQEPDNQWDFFSYSPEATHQFTWLFGDRGIPATLRHTDGFGSHTFQWVNAKGERFWVKFHFKTDQGIQTLSSEEAAAIGGRDPQYHQRDLYAALARGEFPSWTLKVQVMPEADAPTYRFNPFDLTKVWPHADYPLIKVGTMELNRNPENYFAQIEQATFAPSNFVPGIAASPDKMLQARIFSYADAHRYRVGTNHAQIPVNQPKSQVNNYSQDGAGRYLFNAPSVPVYAPNTLGGPAAVEPQNPAGGWENDGELTLAAHSLHAEDGDFVQAGTLYREVYDDAAKARLLETITGAVGGVKSPGIKERAIQYWTNVDADLGAKLRANLGAASLSDAEAANKIG